MIKIVLTGPESTGKTTLGTTLATYFKTSCVPEFSRIYLETLNRPYTQHDLLEIARGQVGLEIEYEKKAGDLLFLDTSLEVIKIWSLYRYGHCDPWIEEQLQQRPHDLYLLCAPDIPWVHDPLRENPNDRNLLFDIYRRELRNMRRDFLILNGQGADRLERAAEQTEEYILLKKNEHEQRK
jgi:nicotinamide riboside kinase